MTSKFPGVHREDTMKAMTFTVTIYHDSEERKNVRFTRLDIFEGESLADFTARVAETMKMFHEGRTL
jgi:hypothetical protein